MESSNHLMDWLSQNETLLQEKLQLLMEGIEEREVKNVEDLAHLFKEIMSDLPGGYSNLMILIEESTQEIVEFIFNALHSFHAHIPEHLLSENSLNHLDTGNKKTLIRIILAAVSSLRKAQPTDAHNQNKVGIRFLLVIRRVLLNTLGPIGQNLGRALLCIQNQHFETAKSCLHLSVVLLIKRLQPTIVVHETIKYEGHKEQLKIAGSKGRNKRWANKDKVEQFALELRNSRKFQNDSHAATELTYEIMEFGKNNDHPFTNQFQARDCIYKWFNRATKREKKSSSQQV